MGFYTTEPVDDQGVVFEKRAVRFFRGVHRRNARSSETKTHANKGFQAVVLRTTAPGVPLYGYRHLSTELGRWPSRDPIGKKGGFNVYGFVRNSPADLVDVMGLLALWPFPPDAFLPMPEPQPPEPQPPSLPDIPDDDGEPTAEECSVFPWVGKWMGSTNPITCKTKFTGAYHSAPSVVQNCTKKHENVHSSNCKKRGRWERCKFAFDKCARSKEEVDAHGVSIACADEALDAEPPPSEIDKLALRCYLKGIKTHMKKYQDVLDSGDCK